LSLSNKELVAQPELTSNAASDAPVSSVFRYSVFRFNGFKLNNFSAALLFFLLVGMVLLVM
jgi:hypothetical protein